MANETSNISARRSSTVFPVVAVLAVLFLIAAPLRSSAGTSAGIPSADADSSEVVAPDIEQGEGDEDDLDTPTPSSIAPTRTSTDTLAIYDLRGRRITTPQRHTLYIYKGKKYVRR